VQEKIIYVCYRVMGILYAPLISVEEIADILDEYYQYLNDCFSNKTVQYRDMLRGWSQDVEFTSFRSKVLTTFSRVLKNFDAFIVGLLVDEMPTHLRASIDEFRIYRDDYHVVKSLYQDLFELTSQALVFLGAFINLSKRGDPWHYVTGIKSYKAFKKCKAFKRFNILVETPRLASLLGAVSRPMRNTIGHFSADYDPCSGRITYDDGATINYLEFLAQFYAAVKALWIILIVVEKVDLDTSRLLGKSSPT
jgi:hypothetical protein